MDKKSIQTVTVMIFTGLLFLQSLFAGGVASRETGLVLSAMRSLRRADNLHYTVEIYHTQNDETMSQTQEIWANLLTGMWAAEYSSADADGSMTVLKEFCDGNQVLSCNAGIWSPWSGYSDDTDIPNFTTFSDINYEEEDIAEAESIETDDGMKIVFSLADAHLERERDALLDESAWEEEGADDGLELYYEQYENTRFENITLIYTVDTDGVLTGMEYSFEASRPQILIGSGGQEQLGEQERYLSGARVTLLEYNSTGIDEKLSEVAADAGYDK